MGGDLDLKATGNTTPPNKLRPSEMTAINNKLNEHARGTIEPRATEDIAASPVRTPKSRTPERGVEDDIPS